MDQADQDSLQAYYNCISQQGFDFGGLANLVGAFATGDPSQYVVALNQANLDAQKSQGCEALLTQPMKDMLARAQQNFMQRQTQLHGGEYF